jgi:actin-related protein
MTTQPIVIELSPDFIRAGFADKNEGPRISLSLDDIKKITRFSSKELKLILADGSISNNDELKKVLLYIFDELLRVDKSKSRVLLVISDLTKKDDRVEIQTIFYNIGIKTLYFQTFAALELFSLGKITGTVVHSTKDNTYTVPILDGRIIEKAIKVSPIGSDLLTSYFIKKLSEKGMIFDTENEDTMNELKSLKNNACYIAKDIVQETIKISICNLEEFALKSGEVISLDTIRCILPEMLFKPMLFEVNCLAVPDMISNSIRFIDASKQVELFTNIVLSGENTVFRGYNRRLTYEIMNLPYELTNLQKEIRDSKNPNIVLPLEEDINCLTPIKYDPNKNWLNGSNFCSTKGFEQLVLYNKI